MLPDMKTIAGPPCHLQGSCYCPGCVAEMTTGLNDEPPPLYPLYGVPASAVAPVVTRHTHTHTHTRLYKLVRKSEFLYFI